MTPTIKVLEIGYLEERADAILASSDPEYVEHNLRYMLDFYGLINVSLRYSRVFWRGRKCGSPEGFSNVSDLGVPPTHLVGAGRLNHPGRPVLYLSPNQFSVFAELDVEEGSYVQLMSYEFKADQKLTCGILGEITQVFRWGNALLSSELGAQINRILNGMQHEGAKSFVYTDSFLSSVMQNPSAQDHAYLHSRTLANLLFEKNSSVDAIIYPGNKLDGAMNYAVKPEAGERVLCPSGSAVVRVDKRYRYGIYSFTPVKIATKIDAAGGFVWS